MLLEIALISGRGMKSCKSLIWKLLPQNGRLCVIVHGLQSSVVQRLKIKKFEPCFRVVFFRALRFLTAESRERDCLRYRDGSQEA